MKFKVEILADNMKDLINKMQETYWSLHLDEDYCDRIESKGVSSIFFTEHSNIYIIDSETEDI